MTGKDDRPEYMKQNDAKVKEWLKAFTDDDLILGMFFSMIWDDERLRNAALNALRRLAREAPEASGEIRLRAAMNAVNAVPPEALGPPRTGRTVPDQG